MGPPGYHSNEGPALCILPVCDDKAEHPQFVLSRKPGQIHHILTPHRKSLHSVQECPKKPHLVHKHTVWGQWQVCSMYWLIHLSCLTNHPSVKHILIESVLWRDLLYLEIQPPAFWFRPTLWLWLDLSLLYLALKWYFSFLGEIDETFQLARDMSQV